MANIKEANPLYGFIKYVFENHLEYSKISRSEKSKYFFMLQRLMSIAFPIQANAFNHVKVSQPEISDYWHESLSKLYSKTPGWIYTKTKKSEKKKKSIEMPSDEAVTYYLERTKMSKRELNDAIKLFGDEALEPIRRIESIMKEK